MPINLDAEPELLHPELRIARGNPNVNYVGHTMARRCVVGVWNRVLLSYGQTPGTYEELWLTPHNTAWPAVRLEYNRKSNENQYVAAGWYLEMGVDPPFIHRRRDEAMYLAEMEVAVRITGGDRTLLSGGEPRTRLVACRHCGKANEVTR